MAGLTDHSAQATVGQAHLLYVTPMLVDFLNHKWSRSVLGYTWSRAQKTGVALRCLKEQQDGAEGKRQLLYKPDCLSLIPRPHADSLKLSSDLDAYACCDSTDRESPKKGNQRS